MVLLLSQKLEFQYIHLIPSAHTRTVQSINWSPKGDLLASGSFDLTALIWNNHKFNQRLDQADAQDLEDNPGRARSPILDSKVKGVTWNQNGNLLATCSQDKSLWIWEIQVRSELQDHQNMIQDDEGYKVSSVLMENEQDVKS
ncbi:uncharacterized protein PGTG_20141, partial [Puccinia graminis f. sp. tritici CRL 75-36-700-3]